MHLTQHVVQALPKTFGLECALHLAAHSGMQSLFDLTIGIGEDAGEGTWGAGAVLGGLTGGGVVVGGFTAGGGVNGLTGALEGAGAGTGVLG